MAVKRSNLEIPMAELDKLPAEERVSHFKPLPGIIISLKIDHRHGTVVFFICKALSVNNYAMLISMPAN